MKNTSESISFIDTLTKKLFLNPSDLPIIVDSNFMMANITGTTNPTIPSIVDTGAIIISGITTPLIFDYATLIQNSGNITTTMIFPNATGGSATAIFESVSKPTSDGRGLILIGEKSEEIKNWEFSNSTICDNSCTITYNFNSTHAAVEGLNPLDVVIFMDPEEDGTFIELVTTVVDNGDDTYTATALTFSSGTLGAFGAKVTLSLSGSGSGDRNPPSFDLGFDKDEYPISIQGNNFKLPRFENEIETIVLETGEPVRVVVKIYEDGGPSNVDYFALYTNLEYNVIQGSSKDTSLIFQKGEEFSFLDPYGLFSFANLTKKQEVGDKLELTFDIVFEKPMPKKDIILVAWDFKRDRVQTTLLDAWEVVESGNATQAEVLDKEIIQSEEETEEIVTPISEITIPSWIKSNASWWYDGTINDEEFVQGIKYLINEKIMTIPQTESGKSTENDIPSWIKNNAGWWAEDEIDDETFVQAIQYLITNGILAV
jgi:hypothetical protein